MRHSPDLCSLPKRGRSQAPSLRRHCPASQVLRACPPPHTAQPGPRGLPVGDTTPPLGLPVLRRTSLYACRRHYPGGTVGCARCSLPQRQQPSPKFSRVGSRIALFEACSAFTTRYGLHTRRVALRPSTPEASEISLPTSPLRLLPTCLPSFRRRQAGATVVGWDSHPLEIRAFSRRTELFRLSSCRCLRSGQIAVPRTQSRRINMSHAFRIAAAGPMK